MKRILMFFSVCLIGVSLSACGKSDRGDMTSMLSAESTTQSDAMDEVLKAEPLEDSLSDADREGDTGEIEETKSDTVLPETGAQEGKDSDAGTDPYAGEYNDYDVNEPNLQIQKNEDGTYTIQMGIYRLAFLDDGAGNGTDHGIEFTATAPDGNKAEGIITLEDDIATVRFTEGWSDFSEISEFKYYKTSDTPNIDILK